MQANTSSRTASMLHPAIMYSKVNDVIGARHSASWEIGTLEPYASMLRRATAPYAYEHISSPGDFNASDVELLVDGKCMGTLAAPDVEKLRGEAVPSPFGKGSETVVDPSVRAALEIPAGRISFKWVEGKRYYSKPNPASLINKAQGMAPLGMEFETKLHKLCLYGEGDFFREHVDTMHGHSHMASAVLALPTPHTGGQLVIKAPRSNDEETGLVCDFASLFQATSDEKNEKVTLPYTVFYTDCPHQVLPVTSGVRVTLQYDLFAKPLNYFNGDSDEEYSSLEPPRKLHIVDLDGEVVCQPIPSQAKKGVSEASTQAALQELCQAFMEYYERKEEANLAILLHHRYHSAAVMPEKLKKADELLYTALSKHFTCELTPILMSVESDYEGSYCSDESSLVVQPFVCKDADFEGHDSSDESENDFQPDHPTGKVIVIAGSQDIVLTCIKHVSYIENTGNEAVLGENHYFGAALVLTGLKEKK